MVPLTILKEAMLSLLLSVFFFTFVRQKILLINNKKAWAPHAGFLIKQEVR